MQQLVSCVKTLIYVKHRIDAAMRIYAQLMFTQHIELAHHVYVMHQLVDDAKTLIYVKHPSCATNSNL